MLKSILAVLLHEFFGDQVSAQVSAQVSDQVSDQVSVIV